MCCQLSMRYSSHCQGNCTPLSLSLSLYQSLSVISQRRETANLLTFTLCVLMFWPGTKISFILDAARLNIYVPCNLPVSCRPYSPPALTSAFTMRLRSHIRPPKRLVDEIQNGTADAARSLRQPTSPPRLRIIEFNPNLPPAAFPTLDTPRPASSAVNLRCVDSKTPAATRHDEENMGIGHIQGNAIGRRAKTANHGIGDDLADVPMESLDNFAASNSDQNLIYHRNMTMMANCIDERGEALVISDSEEEQNRSSSSSSSATRAIVSTPGFKKLDTRNYETESRNRKVPKRPSGAT